MCKASIRKGCTGTSWNRILGKTDRKDDYKVKKRRIMFLLPLTLLCIGASGCGSAENAETEETITETEETTQEKGGTVSLEIFCDESGVGLMNEIIDSFKTEYAGQADFDFTVVTGSESETKEVIFGDVNNSPDVFIFPDDQLDTLIGAGVLSPVVHTDKVVSENVEGSVNAATKNGTLYAYPLTADNGYFMYYNSEYFSESDVTTLSKMLDIASEAEKKITLDVTSGWYSYCFFGNTGLTLKLNEDGITNSCDWNSTEGAIKGVDVAQAMLDICANPGFLVGGDDVLLTGFEDGSVIAGVSGVWYAAKIKELLGENYAAAKLPTYTVAGQEVQMASFTGYKLVGVNYYCDNTEWAHTFAEWLTNEQNQTLRFEELSQGPSNIAAGESEEVHKEPAIVAVIEQSQYGTLQRVGNHYWDPVNFFGNTMANGNPDNSSLQDLLDAMVSGITSSSAQ